MISPQMYAFLQAEISNDSDSDEPTTFGSALGSLPQMTDEVLQDLNPEMREAPGTVAQIRQELGDLIRIYGADNEVYFQVNQYENLLPPLKRRSLRKSSGLWLL